MDRRSANVVCLKLKLGVWLQTESFSTRSKHPSFRLADFTRAVKQANPVFKLKLLKCFAQGNVSICLSLCASHPPRPRKERLEAPSLSCALEGFFCSVRLFYSAMEACRWYARRNSMKYSNFCSKLISVMRPCGSLRNEGVGGEGWCVLLTMLL